MHFPITTIFALAATLSFAAAQDATAQKIGWTGTLSSLDGGLGGDVSVVDSKTLLISNYKLKDASAPALYWWGATDDNIKGGFRISNEQVTEAAKTDSLTIALDAGKTTADFTTVGLWCERLSADFGQATLKANTTASTPTTMATAASASTASATATGGASGLNVAAGVGNALAGAAMLAAFFV